MLALGASVIVPPSAFALVAAPTGYRVPSDLVGDGRTDDTAALQAAIASREPIFLPPRRYRVTKEIVLPPATVVVGSSSRTTKIVVDREFDLNAKGVFRFRGGEPAAEISNLGFEAEQPDSSDRASLIKYPPMIYAFNSPRFRLNHIRIERAYTGIDMSGNSGGALIDDLEISALDTALIIDGALDSVRIQNIHVWPFGLTAKQKSIYKSNETIGLRCGRCDDLHFSNSTIFGLERAAIFEKTKRGTTFGSIVGVDFDDRGGLSMENASLRIAACTFTIGPSNAYGIVAKSGALDLAGCYFFEHHKSIVPIVSLGGGNGLTATLSGISFSTGPADMVHIDAGDGADIAASAIAFLKTPDKLYDEPLIRIAAGARAAFSSLAATPLGRGSGRLFRLGEPHSVQITGISAPGWTIV